MIVNELPPIPELLLLVTRYLLAAPTMVVILLVVPVTELVVPLIVVIVPLAVCVVKTTEANPLPLVVLVAEANDPFASLLVQVTV